MLKPSAGAAALWGTCILLAGVSGSAGEKAPPPPPSELVLLEPGSFWRCRLVWETDLARKKSGELVHVKGFKTVTVPVKGRRRGKRIYVLDET